MRSCGPLPAAVAPKPPAGALPYCQKPTHHLLPFATLHAPRCCIRSDGVSGERVPSVQCVDDRALARLQGDHKSRGLGSTYGRWHPPRARRSSRQIAGYQAPGCVVVGWSRTTCRQSLSDARQPLRFLLGCRVRGRSAFSNLVRAWPRCSSPLSWLERARCCSWRPHALLSARPAVKRPASS